ncbi:MAG: hypothetical protein K0S09_564 [Sphingobacteriaceae bacterium]|jgi:uncharacterized protein (TIGR02271 family)|nr:hypothetical protein [Sphingobacteriaceae bacterium]
MEAEILNNRQNAFADENNDGRKVIQVLEEKVAVEKEIVETGKIILTKKVHIEDEVINIPLVEDHVNVERVAVNQYVESAPSMRLEGDKTIIPVLKEVLVVQKRLMLVEELHITRTSTETTQTKHIPVKREEIKIDRNRTHE